MTAGRPIGSVVRQNIIEILYFMKKGYGYEVHKAYIELFPKVSQRLIYYHLRKGVLTGEFIVKSVKEKGEYSWGETAEKKYYENGAGAKPKVSSDVKTYFEKKKKQK
ncbi:MAG: hypothetical protein KJ583_05245 [Nanoarchaeota archaeon]|nr:hypothetical protein [Nanoarchaeota archaeon]MBU1269573.1 hypothetical protein [Nanoarchaeota archaeon]MBU1604695.1 hypothetical protein [Nanoarchaeota archaeon]MBU2443834.1 hypothetical protein [Nanoarchaeota archaeon]